MLINWFTVIAQIINFLILVWLLKKFLYKPVLKAIADREKLVRDQLDQAKNEMALAEKEKSEFQQKNNEITQTRKAKLEAIDQEAQLERKNQLEEIRQEASELKEKWQQSLQASKEKFSQTLSKKIRTESLLMAGKSLQELADTTMEELIIRKFLNTLKVSLEGNALWNSLLKKADAEIKIKTAFELNETQKTQIIEGLTPLFKSVSPIHFILSKDLIAGIELEVEGYKIGWNIPEYFDALKQEMEQVLEVSQTFS